MASVIIDLNVRTDGNRTYASLDQVSGVISVGHPVTVLETESELRGDAFVSKIDVARNLVYLDVDWSSLHVPAAGQDAEVMLKWSPWFDSVFGTSVHLDGGAYYRLPSGLQGAAPRTGSLTDRDVTAPKLRERMYA